MVQDSKGKDCLRSKERETMTVLEKMVRRARVKMRMMMDCRRYTPPQNECFDMIVDNLGVRFSTTILSVFDETASIVSLDYGDETRRTIDSVLDYDKDEPWNWSE